MNTTLTSRSKAFIFVVLAACALLLVPDAAFARGGGGRGGGRSGGSRKSSSKSRKKTSRKGPASSGSTKRSRAKASSRKKPAAKRPAAKKPDKRPGTRPGTRPVERKRWRRRRNARRVAVVDWDGDCTESETVDGVVYHYCDGSWWEKVYDSGDVYWIQVDKP